MCAVGDQRTKRAAALVAAAVDAESVLCRRVWHELVSNFYWWQVGRDVVEQTALIDLLTGKAVERVVEVVTEWLTTGRALGVGGVDSW